VVQLIEANWLAFVLALLIGLVVAWWLFARGSKGPGRSHAPDVLDEGAGPAQRNQALIDAPSAASRASAIIPGPATGAMAGLGEVVAVAAQDQVEEVEARAEAKAEAAGAAVSAAPDDLARIKGVGPKLVALLHGLGVTHFAQISAWDDAAIDRIDAQLGTFAGRIRRDAWVEQARLLASGDTSAYEAKFGKL
jgi:predicted flap endonuclease-1-like 5' DNA nuclease